MAMYLIVLIIIILFSSTLQKCDCIAGEKSGQQFQLLRKRMERIYCIAVRLRFSRLKNPTPLFSIAVQLVTFHRL